MLHSLLQDAYDEQQKYIEVLTTEVSDLETRLAEKERYCFVSRNEVLELRGKNFTLSKEKRRLQLQVTALDIKLKQVSTNHRQEMESRITDVTDSLEKALEALQVRISQLDQKLQEAENMLKIIKV